MARDGRIERTPGRPALPGQCDALGHGPADGPSDARGAAAARGAPSALAAAALLAAALCVSGCIGWQARKLVEPPRLGAGKQAVLDEILVRLSADGLATVGEAPVGRPPVPYRYLVLEPAHFDHEYELTPTDKGFHFAFRFRSIEALACAPRGTLVFLHGYGGNAMQALAWAPELSTRCLRIVAPDLRAHGRSGGERVTYGARESEELAALLAHLEAAGTLRGPVSVLGLSLGGTLALRLASEARPNVERTIAVAPFERGDLAARRAIEAYGFHRSEGRTEKVLARAAELGAFDWNETEVREPVAGTAVVIASEADAIAPAVEACALARRIGATCDRLQDPRWAHEALMLPTPDVRAAVLEALGLDGVPPEDAPAP